MWPHIKTFKLTKNGPLGTPICYEEVLQKYRFTILSTDISSSRTKTESLDFQSHKRRITYFAHSYVLTIVLTIQVRDQLILGNLFVANLFAYLQHRKYSAVPKVVVDSGHSPSFLYGFLISRNYSLECTPVASSGHKNLTLQLTQIHFFVKINLFS